MLNFFFLIQSFHLNRAKQKTADIRRKMCGLCDKWYISYQNPNRKYMYIAMCPCNANIKVRLPRLDGGGLWLFGILGTNNSAA